MVGIVDWAIGRARMILAFIAMSIIAGAFSYANLPKEGAPDIDIPVLFVSAVYPGISAEDSERLLVKPLENKLGDATGLDTMSSTAAEGYGGIALEFGFDWDREATLADVRDKVSQAEGSLPDGVSSITINEINFSEFPIIILALSGAVPERTLLRVAKDLQSEIEAMGEVLEVGIAGQRDEMLEVVIDPLKLEAYNVTAGELINAVSNNNRLIAAGEVQVGTGAYAIKIPSAFDDPQDVFDLPVKRNGDRMITIGDIADIRLTFEDRQGTARFNGEETVALQVVKRKGANLIDTVALVREVVAAHIEEWPEELKQAVEVNFSLDSSAEVQSMVDQLLASVLTAIALVMIVVLAALGIRSSLLVGFAIPTSFLLTFAILSVMGIPISNIVMFGLILAVGMLVDGAIVVVEYADKKVQQGIGPMRAYGMAAKRMFWPIVSSTATTLCAFLPFLFWPGIAGQFMSKLPVTIIIVLSASLLVALVYLPVVGGVAGRISRIMQNISDGIREKVHFILRLLFSLAAAAAAFYSMMTALGQNLLIGGIAFVVAAMVLSIFVGSLKRVSREKVEIAGYKRSSFGRFINFISGNPFMPIITLVVVGLFVSTVFNLYGKYGNGFEFFVETEPERAVAYVRARGNLSLNEKDRLVMLAEEAIAGIDGVAYVFAFAGSGGLNTNNGGAVKPVDTIGEIQIELAPYDERVLGKLIIAEIDDRLAAIPGVQAQIVEQSQGPASGAAIFLRVKGSNWEDLLTATEYIRTHLNADPDLKDQEDTRPLPGIDWQLDVDVEQAGRFGTDVASIGGMVQLVTRGLTLGTMRTDTSDEEIDIRVRFPEEDRLLSTLDTLRVRTPQALVPLSNFVTRSPVPKLGEINRIDQERYFNVTAGVADGVNANEKVLELTEWLETEAELPRNIEWEFTGDTEEQAETAAFLMVGFMGALGLMFVILLAQFNSFYHAILVLVAVVLSTTGVLIGMMVMGQPFSFIMTGTGIVALAGIVVNNNIVLIDTYQEYSKFLPKLEAITRTAEARIRPVLLTTITTMAGLAPMMLGLSIDFINGGYTVDAPTALWWKQLATAVVFGLGLATVLTLVVTPALLSLPVWISSGAYGFMGSLRGIFGGKDNRIRADRKLAKTAKKTPPEDVVWD
ncbi:MAG: efflux RND transporter permease subunit [Rhodobacteraceae bacterium]|nr:efflux RND transporter permease subunit [Paracoccaceae bacterium]